MITLSHLMHIRSKSSNFHPYKHSNSFYKTYEKKMIKYQKPSNIPLRSKAKKSHKLELGMNF